MDRKKIQSILQDALEDEISSSQINLLPNVKERLVAGTIQQGENMYKTNSRYMRRVTLAALAVGALLIVAFASPQGRAFAQNILQFFKRSDSTVLPLPPDQNAPTDDAFMPTAQPPTPLASVAESSTSLSFPLEIKEAESLAGFNVFEPTWLPDVLSFKGAAFESEEWQRKQNTVKTFYSFSSDKYGPGLESNGVVLTQQPVDAVEECEICDLVGPSTEVQIVQIGNTTGEYVVGVWASDNAGNRVWQDEPYLQTLRWQAGGMAFELLYMGIPEEVTQADLIAIAESMK